MTPIREAELVAGKKRMKKGEAKKKVISNGEKCA